MFSSVLPPLRNRSEDIPGLVEHFAAQVCAQNGWKAIPFSADAMEALKAHPWPGNVRELRNIVERLMLLATDGQVDVATVQLSLPKTLPGGHLTAPLLGPARSPTACSRSNAKSSRPNSNAAIRMSR